MECSRNRVPLMQLLTIVVLSGTFFSCAPLSKGQMKAVTDFATVCDSFSKYPSTLFIEMANVRSSRGIYFASSLSTPELRVEELNSIYSAMEKDISLAKKCNISMEVIGGYSRALKLLAGESRWKDSGREFRSLGRSIDSLAAKINAFDFIDDAIPLGFGKSAGRIVGYSMEMFKRRAQARAVKDFVSQGDTLVSVVIGSLVKVLRSQEVTSMIENERKSLEQNYISYLKSGNSDDKGYLALKKRVESLSYARGAIISSANRLIKSHNKIAQSMHNGRDFDEIFTDITNFQKEVKVLTQLFNSL